LGKLIAGGDSFIYGSELKDCFRLGDNAPPKEVYSQSTYTALLAKELGLDYVCAAIPGYSNSAIRRSVMNECEQHVDIEQVVVTWSFPGRYEFRFNSSWQQISPWSITDDAEKTIKKDFQSDNPIVFQHHLDKLQREQTLGISDFARVFYSKIGGSEYWEVYHSLLDIVLLQQYLELRNIPYLFLGVDECLLDNVNKHLDDITVKTLQQQLNLNNWYWFPKHKGFYTWAKEEKFPFATTHPREEAHIEAAHLIYEHLRYIGRIP
jgi:hypothetical protein